jgi:hypothetical protein
MSYRSDYAQEARKLQDLAIERERLAARITASQKRLICLAGLLGEDELGAEAVAATLQKGAMTDTIRRLLSEAKGPLPSKRIVTELQKVGLLAGSHVNPAASVNSILKRLQDQGFARRSGAPGARPMTWEQVRFEGVMAEQTDVARMLLQEAATSPMPLWLSLPRSEQNPEATVKVQRPDGRKAWAAQDKKPGNR